MLNSPKLIAVALIQINYKRNIMLRLEFPLLHQNEGPHPLSQQLDEFWTDTFKRQMAV